MILPIKREYGRKLPRGFTSERRGRQSFCYKLAPGDHPHTCSYSVSADGAGCGGGGGQERGAGELYNCTDFNKLTRVLELSFLQGSSIP